MSYVKELQRYKDAVWSYVLEHSDLTPEGKFFVKFHTSGRPNFEDHVFARMGGYHRGDPTAKQLEHQELRFAEERNRYEAQIRNLKNKLRGRRMLFLRSIFKKLHIIP